MNRLEASLSRLATDLNQVGARWALVGGLAVSARTEPRFTRDLDVAVAVTEDAQAETLVHRLTQMGYAIVASIEQEAAHRVAAVRLAPSGESSVTVVADILFASSGVEPEIVDGAEHLEIVPGLVVPVAGIGDLLALKILSRDDERRPQDAVDIRALLATSGSFDLERAREQLRRITDRGFHRDRDLLSALEHCLGAP